MLNQLQLRRRDGARYALIDGPLEIGWIRAGIIGFGGFDDRREALAAGEAAAAIVTHWAEARRAALVPLFPGDWTGLATRVLAPGDVDIDVAGHGFEVSLPPETWVAVMLEVAQRIHRGLKGTARASLGGHIGPVEVTA